MVDHVWGIGGGAEMMIRDHGVGNGHVEFWFHAGAQTWNNQQDWGYDAGWGYVGGVFKLNTGGGWHHLGTVHIPTSRNVMMRMVGEGLGWGTSDRTAWIPRATVPNINYGPHATVHNHHSAYIGTYLGGDGGSGYTAHEMWGSTDGTPRWHWLNWHYGDVGGLAKGTKYYFWSRSANALGWSGWSHRGEFTTHREPDAPSAVWFENVQQRSVRARFYGGWDGGTPVREWQLTYGLNPTTGEVYIASNGTSDLSNLETGRTYYFWARGRNDVGWGPWSPVRAQTLRAGAMVHDGGVWKRAVPYVKVNGVWRLARPYVKHAGVWKETS